MKLVIDPIMRAFPLKEEVRDYLAKAGHEIVDLGPSAATTRTTTPTLPRKWEWR